MGLNEDKKNAGYAPASPPTINGSTKMNIKSFGSNKEDINISFPEMPLNHPKESHTNSKPTKKR